MEPNGENNDQSQPEKKEPSNFEKIINLNKLGAVCLAGDKIDKSIQILQKTVDFYEEKLANKEIPNFFYSNLYSNLAKAYSVKKEFDKAAPLYSKSILNHPIYKILLNNRQLMEDNFCIKIENLIEIDTDIKLEDINKKFNIICNFFKENQEFEPILKFKPNNLNSLTSFTDSLVNLAVIYQYKSKETNTAFNMYYLAILCDPHNRVANIDFNNFLRELNLKHLSDRYIVQRINSDRLLDLKNNENNLIKEIDIKFLHANIGVPNVLSIVCMKWGTKYGADYVNKLFNGIKRNFTKKFEFFCITDDFDGLNPEIKPLLLESEFKGWMKKSILFNPKYTKNFSRKIMFIDLDMIIVNNIDFVFDYEGDFALMKTDDIQCEGSKDGYNSSIVIWRNGFGEEIYQTVLKYHEYITKQIIRFDHYLEFIIKNSEFVQDLFPMKILDYNFYCKDKQTLIDSASIIAFPRSPKPHECNEKWVLENWI